MEHQDEYNIYERKIENFAYMITKISSGQLFLWTIHLGGSLKNKQNQSVRESGVGVCGYVGALHIEKVHSEKKKKCQERLSKQTLNKSMIA